MRRNPPRRDKETKRQRDKETKAEPVVIDFDGIDQRIVALPVPAANYSRLQAGPAGQVYYLETPAAPPRGETAPRGATLQRFDLAKRKSETALPGVGDYHLTADGKKAL